MSPAKLMSLVLASAAFVAIAGCVRSQFDPVAEGKALLQRDAEWANLATAGKDVDKIVAYWSDDAVVIEPGQPVVAGKAAIRAYVAESLKAPDFSIHWVSRDPVFSADGSMAYMPGADVMTMPGADGKPNAGWGLHLIDVNLAMGNLLEIVETQSKAWLAKK